MLTLSQANRPLYVCVVLAARILALLCSKTAGEVDQKAFFFFLNSAVATLPQGACTQRSNGEMKRQRGRQMEGFEMEGYKAGRLVELEVFQRETKGGGSGEIKQKRTKRGRQWGDKERNRMV